MQAAISSQIPGQSLAKYLVSINWAELWVWDCGKIELILDPFVGHLATPITSSAVTRAILQNLPAYRFGLTPLLRGLEIGLAHGYFLIGPFTKLGPLRNSDIALFAGFLSTIGLIIILTLGLTIYGIATFSQEKSQASENELQTRKAWNRFKGGFFVGACGSAGFAFICLSSIPTFN